LKILSVSNISKSFDDPLFSGVSFEIDSNDKIGLVGANGIGKTTLLKIILEKTPADSGDIFKQKFLSIGYMEQHLNLELYRTVYEEALSIFSFLSDIEADLDQIHHDIDNSTGDLESLVNRQYSLQKSFDEKGGLTYKSRTRSMLLGLGFTDTDLDKKTSSLSGGEQTKVSLAKMLLSNASLLLLDEPTNHLDINSVEWLESFMAAYPGAFIVISHDRRFLDGVTNKTFDMKHGKLKTYIGSYSDYIKQKELDEEQILRDNKNVQKEITRINAIIEQQKRWNRARNIKTAKSKQKVVDKLSLKLKETQQKDKQMHVAFDTETFGGKEVVISKGLSKSFGSQTLFTDMDLSISRGEKVFLLGGNGSGKTSLFKILLGEVKADNGEYKTGINVFPAYFDQTQSNLDEDKTVIESISDEYPKMGETEIRSILGSFLFVEDEVFKRVKDISGGERARLSLLLLMLSKANFLLLDEPTNHLDIDSKQALQKALSDYPGTMFIISHDRYLINEMADRILYLSDNTLTEYLGNYDYYLSHRQEKRFIKTGAKKNTPAQNDYKQKKEQQSKINRLNGRISRLEEEIGNKESEIAKLENMMAEPDVVNDYKKMLELSKKTEDKNKKVHALYDDLHELEVELSELTAI